MKALILTAGFGTRLGELTRHTPKPLLPLQDKPLLFYAIQHLAWYGYRQIALNLHFQPDMVQSAIGNGSQFGVEIIYSFESELLGTAGALRPLMNFFEKESDFLVYYGDIVTNQDLSELIAFHRARQASATLLVHKRTISNSVIELGNGNRITNFLERPDSRKSTTHLEAWVNSGVQILTPRIFDFLPEYAPADLPRDIYATHTQELDLYGYPLSGYRCAVDSKERYTQVCADFLSGNLTFPFSNVKDNKNAD
jgi:NDP-sugar pyrophosphorylase family protein